MITKKIKDFSCVREETVGSLGGCGCPVISGQGTQFPQLTDACLEI